MGFPVTYAQKLHYFGAFSVHIYDHNVYLVRLPRFELTYIEVLAQFFFRGKNLNTKICQKNFQPVNDISKDIENYNYYKFHSAPTDVVFLGIMISQSLKSPERYNSLLYLQRNKS